MNAGDTAWLLTATALVMIMLPGLALFYGGLVRRKNVLSTIMHSFFGLALVSVVWLVIGFTLTFAPSPGGNGVIGGLDFVLFEKVGLDPDFYARREIGGSEHLPWDHLDVGRPKQALWTDYQQALQSARDREIKNAEKAG